MDLAGFFPWFLWDPLDEQRILQESDTLRGTNISHLRLKTALVGDIGLL